MNDDELAAVIAAVQAMTQTPEQTPAREVARWKRTARLEAVGADVR